MYITTNRRSTKRRKRVVLPILAVAFVTAVVGISVFALEHRAQSPVSTAPVPGKPSARPAQAAPAPAVFDKTRYSVTDPSSPWVVVNKSHPLSPITYAPADLVSAYGKQVSGRMKADLDALMVDSVKAGIGLTLASGYRSYDYQKDLYASYVKADGQEKADRYSARPGYSEHQTGLAVDFGDKAGKCIVEDCYADLPEAKWLAENAYKYGFLLRYTAADQDATGYQAEAWHYRYVGRDLSGEMHSQGVPTLEQFFGIDGGSSYSG